MKKNSDVFDLRKSNRDFYLQHSFFVAMSNKAIKIIYVDGL